MSRYCLTLEYDGSGFAGWQDQPGEETVQGALERALVPLCGHPVTVIGAGRTDAGVHALGQRAHFDSNREREPRVIRRALNATTPRGLSVLDVVPVLPQFHARRSAIWRRYRYRIGNGEVAPALDRERVWHIPRPLVTSTMQEAVGLLLGTHDFSAFRAASCQAHHPVRSVIRAEVGRSGDLIEVELVANAFLQHMVRNIVGTLVRVGSGDWEVSRFAEVFARGDRRLAGATAPPWGLYLVEVGYPPMPGGLASP
ncbi:MAG: tRNA pseudouridine(38-40) synthase TruA [Magnetococcales bacterium]|nr:tRNA pseudouridine(38-40) synthase TruA [Magnetococcales bacterium]MBF0156323.1 tRNA pseudouridine(38-40) synthase TruA [Magnetococcales bacterium]